MLHIYHYIFLDLTITGSLEINNLNEIDVRDLTNNPFKDGSYKKNLKVEVKMLTV